MTLNEHHQVRSSDTTATSQGLSSRTGLVATDWDGVEAFPGRRKFYGMVPGWRLRSTSHMGENLAVTLTGRAEVRDPDALALRTEAGGTHVSGPQFSHL